MHLLLLQNGENAGGGVLAILARRHGGSRNHGFSAIDIGLLVGDRHNDADGLGRALIVPQISVGAQRRDLCRKCATCDHGCRTVALLRERRNGDGCRERERATQCQESLHVSNLRDGAASINA